MQENQMKKYKQRTLYINIYIYICVHPRDLRRDLRGERHPWLALEARPDSPGEIGRAHV